MPAKLLMLEYVEIGLVAYLVEIIHIKLPNKWWEIAMAKIDGKHFLLKLVNVLDNKGRSVMVPLNDVLVLLILNRKSMYL